MVLGNWYTRAGDNIKRPEILRESTWRFESSPYYKIINFKRNQYGKIKKTICKKD